MKKQELWVKTTDNYKLHVKAWGDEKNPAMILVHGYPDNQEVWDGILEYLIEHFYVITYDVRGAGLSDIPPKILDYRLPQLSKDLEAVANAALSGRAYHLAAHDWGSIQTWESVTEPRFKGKILSYTTISGPCLDHAAFWMRKKFKNNPDQFFKQLAKSWYIMLFHLPFAAPVFWKYVPFKSWEKIFKFLENNQNIQANQNINHDGKFGVSLYRANFIPSLTRPRQRFAQCPVQAVVLEKDKYVSPELVDEMANWVEDLSVTHLSGNHWAVVSQAEGIAKLIIDFAKKH